jgi:hypothetical protein
MKTMALWGLGLLLAGVPVLAHHSFKAEFDETHQITLSGKVAKVAWKNPHVRLFVDVKDEDGKVTNWELELSSPNGLLTQGWKVDTLKPGDQVTVSGFRARETGRNLLNARRISLGAAGKSVASGR